MIKWLGQGNGGQPRCLWQGCDVRYRRISIKPAAGMEDMKWDMGGAAAVAGAMLALPGARLGLM